MQELNVNPAPGATASSAAPEAPAPAAPAQPSPVSNAQAQRLSAYADPWTTPMEAFHDLYDLLPRMTDPLESVQLDGRRGTGKTVLMVNAYLRVRQQFEASLGSPPYTVGIYIDLSQDIGAARDQLPLIRGMLLFQQIAGMILTASTRPGHRRDRRFWGLQDYLDERPHFFRRLIGRWRLERYRAHVDRLADDMYAHPLFQQIYNAQRGLYTPAPKLKPLQTRAAGPAAPAPQEAVRQHRGLPTLVFEKRLVHLYKVFGYKMLDTLEPLLDAMQVQQVILYLDEWSGPSVGSDAQSYLFEQLANTFMSGSRVTLKVATVPGATRLAFDSSNTQVTPVRLDNLASFQPHWLRRRLMRMLILNLSASAGKSFPLQRYLADGQDAADYPAFVQDVFQNEGAADELAQASEGLPRQMLLVFMAALQLQSLYSPRKRLTAGMIRMAARQLFAAQHEVVLNHDRVVSEVLNHMLQAGRRVVDVERLPVFYGALDWLVNEGVVFRCANTGVSAGSSASTSMPMPTTTPLSTSTSTSTSTPAPTPTPTPAPTPTSTSTSTLAPTPTPAPMLPKPADAYIRYRLCYPAEVFRLASLQPAVDPAWYDALRVEQVTSCEYYPDAPRVDLTALAAALFEAEEPQEQS